MMPVGLKPHFGELRLKKVWDYEEGGYMTAHYATIEVDGDHLKRYAALVHNRTEPTTLLVEATDTMGGSYGEVYPEGQRPERDRRVELGGNHADSYQQTRQTADLLYEVNARLERDPLLKSDQPVFQTYYQQVLGHLEKMRSVLEKLEYKYGRANQSDDLFKS